MKILVERPMSQKPKESGHYLVYKDMRHILAIKDDPENYIPTRAFQFYGVVLGKWHEEEFLLSWFEPVELPEEGVLRENIVDLLYQDNGTGSGADSITKYLMDKLK